jgi:hypothetical protein
MLPVVPVVSSKAGSKPECKETFRKLSIGRFDVCSSGAHVC